MMSASAVLVENYEQKNHTQMGTHTAAVAVPSAPAEMSPIHTPASSDTK